MNIYIENMNTIKNRYKVYKNRCRTIFEVIQQYLFDENDIFLDDFIKNGKNNENEAHNMPIEVKITQNKCQWKKDFMQKW